MKSPTKKRSRDSSESGSDHSEGLEVDETEQLAPEESSDDGDGDDSEDEPVRKNKTATPVSAKRRGRPPQNAGTSSAKKPGAKPKGAVRRRPGRKLADEADEPNAAKDTAVSDDNVLFSQ